MDDRELWESILFRLEPTIQKTHFMTWFQDTAVIDSEGDTLIVGVPNPFARDWLEKKYNHKIIQAAQEKKPEIRYAKYEIHSSLTDKEDCRGTNLQNLFKNSVKAVRKIANKPEVKVLPGVSSKILNEKYTLHNFLIGTENRLPHAVCEAVAQNPGSLYSPLFVYGDVGLGKTHLLQAIGNQILHNNPDKVVVYLTSEQFVNEIVNAIGKKNTKGFKNRYRNVDCLIVDDIQFLANKAQSQEEFFHTFNHLYDNNKQIILSSDKPPRELNGFEERPQSRFNMGMVVDVVLPEYETRLAILQRKCQENQIFVTPDVLEFIAYNITNSIRELEGILLQMIARSRVEQTTPNMKMVATMLKKLHCDREIKGYNFETQPEGPKTSADIVNTVAEYFNITSSDLVGPVRRKEIMIPRQICMYILRHELEKSFECIGAQFGGRSHTTVMHACSKISKRLQDDERLIRDLNSIKQTIGFY